MTRKATYIRAWREEKGFTLDQMVGRLEELGVNLTGASLSRIERGKQPYSQDILEAIAEALDVTVAHLIERKPGVNADVVDLLERLDDKQVQQASSVLRAMFGEGA